MRQHTGIVFVVALFPILAGCGDGMLLLAIDSALSVPEQLDNIDVTITASKTDVGDLCYPLSHSFRLESSSELPLVISIKTGEEHDAWLALRVEGFLRDELKISREKLIPLPHSGAFETSVDLQPECYEVSCSSDEHCENGHCVGVPLPRVFDDAESRVGLDCEL